MNASRHPFAVSSIARYLQDPATQMYQHVAVDLLLMLLFWFLLLLQMKRGTPFFQAYVERTTHFGTRDKQPVEARCNIYGATVPWWQLLFCPVIVAICCNWRLTKYLKADVSVHFFSSLLAGHRLHTPEGESMWHSCSKTLGC